MAQQTEVQWTGKTGGGNFGQRFLFGFLKSVKVTVLYPVLPLVVPVYCVVNHKAFGCIFRYFKEIHHFSRWKSFWKTIGNHLIFGQVVLDRFAVVAGNKTQFHLEIEDPKVLLQLLDQPGGAILAGSHIGNFELTGHCLSQNKKRINSVIYGGEGVLMQQKRTNAFSHSNVRLVPVAEDLSHLFIIKEALENGEIVTILCDRIWGSKKTLTIDILGKKAKLPLGTFLLAAQMGVPVVSVINIKVRGRKYHSYVQPLASPDRTLPLRQQSEQIAASYAQSLENVLRLHPEQWFNYFDFWEREIENGKLKIEK
ncbi:MAG: lipid A biosynthesis (KDO)2-(lauroyl)-lipid IVA acyltransferase [Bacteroidales bacterium]|nr:lipid A biosynthesis (KDO)2-(lauroyl)-lipid IVA acyltransferase [Bacteroidales bacterium]